MQSITTKTDKHFLDIEAIRSDFPILKQKIRNRPLIYFDNAATTQKPQVVIDELIRYYSTYNSNVHRGVHYLSQIATEEYEDARRTIQKFINARFEDEIIFTRGATESINLIASSLSKLILNPDDEIILSEMEHHSNIVPWQIISTEAKAKIKVIPIDESGELIFEEFEKILSPRTKIVSIVHISNSLGTINPIKQIIELAHSYGAVVVIDGSQSVQHIPVDVQELDCDFFVFSGHKIYAPTGIGVLYGKKDILQQMPPYQGGGDMILSVSFEKTIYNSLPYKFEPGTPNIEGAIGLKSALNYLKAIGIDKISEYENLLLKYATEKMLDIPGVRIIGTARQKASLISFVVEGVHPHDIGTLLDRDGIAVRTGHLCTEPVMRRYRIPATTRASFAFYNTFDEIELFIESLKKVISRFK